MRQSVYLVVVCVLASFALAQPAWKYCPGSGSSRVSVTKTPISPYPIKKGSPVKFDVIGSAVAAVNQKNARLDVYASGSKIFTTAVGGSYSVGTGAAYDYTFTYAIPSFVPTGTYDIWISMIDTAGSIITCVQLTVAF